MKKAITLLFTISFVLLLTMPTQVSAQLCPTPTGLTTTNIDLFSAELDWNTTINAFSSLLEIRPVGINIWIPIIVQQTPYTVQGLLCGVDYEWRVSAICQLGPISLPSNPSAIQTFTTLSCNNLCPAPTALTSTNVTETDAELSWTPAFAFLTDYNLRYRVVGTAVWTDVSNVGSPYQLGGLQCDTDYEWQVQTLCPNPFGNPIPGAWSTVENFSTDTCPVLCEVPTSLTASNISLYGAQVSWTTTVPPSSYQMRYRLAGTVAWTFITNASNPYLIGSLTCSSIYEWQVRSVCPVPGTINYSSWSTVSTFTTVACATPCPVPAALTVSNISLQSVVLSWTATAPPPTTNQFRYRELGTTSWTLISNATSPYSLVNLSCKTSYEWQIRTICQGTLVSSWSSIDTFTTLDCDAFCPGPFAITTSNITLSSADFSWSVQAPLPVTFQVRYRVAGTTPWIPLLNNTPSSPFSVSNLLCDTDYEWQVRTVCGASSGGALYYSPWSSVISFSTLDCSASCPDPVNMSTTNIALYSASLNWTVNTPASVGFDIRYRLSGTTTWTQIDSVTSPYSLSALKCSTDFEWEVRTVCGNSVSTVPFSNWSPTQSFSTLVCTFACPSPNGLAANNITDQSVELSWLTTAPGTLSFQFRYRVTGTTQWIPLLNNTPSSPYQLGGLTCGTSYQWMVRTVCGTPGNISYSAWSSLGSFTTLGCPSFTHPTSGTNLQYSELKATVAPSFAEMTVFPNPANDIATLKINAGENTQANIAIHDILGKQVYADTRSITIGANEIVLKTSELVSGWYAVTLHTGSKSETIRLIISR